MAQTAFKSNTKGKIQKILNGSVFEDVLTVVTEMFQNSYRARAKNVWVNLDREAGILIFSDDGCGCKKADNIITLDYSEWESTSEGFGIGLLSFLAVPCIEYAKIRSHNWELNIQVEGLMDREYPITIIPHADIHYGFRVELKSQYFRDCSSIVSRRICEDGELQPYNVYYNNSFVIPKDVTSDVSGEFVKTYDNRYFSAKLAVTNDWSLPSIFYEKRFVTEAPYGISRVDGVIELKPRAVTLKEPDRKAIVKNEKYDNFYEKLSQCRINLYKDFISSTSSKTIDRYADSIASVLTVEDYEHVLSMDDIFGNNSDNDSDNVIPFPSVSGSNRSSGVSDSSGCVDFSVRPKRGRKKNSVSTVIKKTSKKVWIRASELDELSDLRAKAEYYGVKVFIANNILYENVFIKHDIPHISSINEGISIQHFVKNAYPKTLKEEAFLEMYRPVCEMFGYSANVIQIADLSEVVETRIDGKLVNREVTINKKDKIVILGCCDGKYIYVDRRALGLRRFNLQGSFGKGHYRAVLASIRTVAHEFAHLKYQTTDATVEHMNREGEIYLEIEKYFNSL